MTANQDQLNIATDLMNELVKNAFDALSDGEVTFGEIVRLGGLLASKANRLGHLSGVEKQKLVVRVVELALQQLLSVSDADREKIERAAQFAKETLPAVLDVAVSAARGKLDLKKPALWMSLLQLLGCIGCQSCQVPVLPSSVTPSPVPAKEVQAVSVSPVAKEKTETLPEADAKSIEIREQESN